MRAEEFFASRPTQGHHAASQLRSVGRPSLLKTRLTAAAGRWEEGARDPKLREGRRAEPLRNGREEAGHRTDRARSYLLRLNGSCETGSPGEGLWEKEGLSKTFLKSERSKMFCCDFLHFTPN